MELRVGVDAARGPIAGWGAFGDYVELGVAFEGGMRLVERG